MINQKLNSKHLPWNNATVTQFPLHGEGLPGASGSVGEQQLVLSLHKVFYHRTYLNINYLIHKIN